MSGLMRTRRAVGVALAALALGGAAACGSDSDKDAGGDGTAATATPTPDNATALRNIKEAPPLPERTGAAPEKLETRDVVEGDGPAAKKGDKLQMMYTGWLYDSGAQFDSSWEGGREPFELDLGAGRVIPGWDKGIVGMKPGGRRILTIPAKDGYGAQGSPPSIPGNAPLIFVVDYLKAG